VGREMGREGESREGGVNFVSRFVVWIFLQLHQLLLQRKRPHWPSTLLHRLLGCNVVLGLAQRTNPARQLMSFSLFSRGT